MIDKIKETITNDTNEMLTLAYGNRSKYPNVMASVISYFVQARADEIKEVTKFNKITIVICSDLFGEFETSFINKVRFKNPQWDIIITAYDDRDRSQYTKNADIYIDTTTHLSDGYMAKFENQSASTYIFLPFADEAPSINELKELKHSVYCFAGDYFSDLFKIEYLHSGTLSIYQWPPYIYQQSPYPYYQQQPSFYQQPPHNIKYGPIM